MRTEGSLYRDWRTEMDQVGDLLNRPRHYYNIDGLAELGGGVLALGIALLLSLPAKSVWHQVSWFVFLGFALAIHHVVKAIKNHVTYPRTGFVEYRRGDRRRSSIISAVVAALIPVGLSLAVRRHWDITALASLAGLGFAAAYAYNIAKAIRWKWVVVCAIALGSTAISFLPADVLAALANDSLVAHPVLTRLCGTMVASFLTCGAILLTSGGISFWLYLHHTRPPAREDQ
jgi:hypothetical protein